MKSLRIFAYLLALWACGTCFRANAQHVQWVRPLETFTFGGEVLYARDNFAVAADGATYVVGDVSANLVLDGYRLKSGGLGDFYVARFDAAGHLTWLRQGRVPSVRTKRMHLTLDAAGGVYVQGEALGNSNEFQGQPLPEGPFLLRITAQAGLFQWVRPLTATPALGASPIAYFEVKRLAADPNGGLYVVGNTAEMRQVQGLALPDASDRVSGFLLRLSASGTAEWVRQVTGTVPVQQFIYEYTIAWNVVVDPHGGAALTGLINSQDSVRISDPTRTEWVRMRSGTATGLPWQGRALAVRYDRQGRLLWGKTGAGWGAAYDGVFDAHDQLTLLAYGGGANTALTRFSATGTARWMRGYPINMWLKAIVPTADGGLLTAGSGVGWGDTYGTTTVPATSALGEDAFLLRLDSVGAPQWGSVTQLPGDESYHQLGIDQAGNAYAFGWDANGNLPLPGGGRVGSSRLFITRLNMQSAQLSGRVYLDANANSRRDPGETPFPRPVRVEEAAFAAPVFSDPATGYYSLLRDSGQYQLAVPAPPIYYTITEGSAGYTGTVGLGEADTTRHFGLTPVANQRDLRVTLTPYTPARRGIPTRYRARVENVGTVATNYCVVRVALDSAVTVVGMVPPNGQSGHYLQWPVGNLAPFATRDFEVILNVPLNVPVGQHLVSIASLTVGAIDVNPADNIDTLRQVVVGSCDPNDISVNYSTLTAAQVAASEPLDYVVRFQNVGTDTAFAVVIQDTLPAGLLQLGSVELISQSHNVSWMLSGPGLLTIRFPGIRLPQQAVDAVRSQGFVRFRIAPRATLPPGTRIPNTAHIVFDFNAPVSTNQALTLVQGTLGLPHEPGANAALALYPNPATDRVTVPADAPTAGVLLDALGRPVRRFTAPTTLEVRGLPPGLYVVRVGSRTQRLVVE